MKFSSTAPKPKGIYASCRALLLVFAACHVVHPTMVTGFHAPRNNLSGRRAVAAAQSPITKGVRPHPLGIFQEPKLVTVSKLKNTSDEPSSGATAKASSFWDEPTINPIYAAAYLSFIGYAFVRTMTEPEGASMEILEKFLADPINPGCNELFVAIFNLLGLFFVPAACLLMPGAKDQKLPATPFILGSCLGGFGLLGPYAITRTPVTSVSQSDLGWFTSNVLENKLFNFAILAMTISAYVTSGCINAFVSDADGLVQGYGQLFSETAIASASSVDFFILTLFTASLVPEDLARRGVKSGISPYVIAACTALLPGVGVALYCALRPGLEEE